MSDEDEAGALSASLSTYLETLDLKPHELPIAQLARTLARAIEGGDFSASAVKEFRATVRELVPVDAQRHRSQTNADRVTGTSEVGDDEDARPSDEGRRSGAHGGDAGLPPASVAARAGRRGVRGR